MRLISYNILELVTMKFISNIFQYSFLGHKRNDAKKYAKNYFKISLIMSHYCYYKFFLICNFELINDENCARKRRKN